MEGRDIYEAIVIGASWGGTEAVTSILKGLPIDYALPVIVVLHRQKNTVSHLVEIMRKHIKMEVQEVNEKEPVRSGIVYVAPANYHVLIELDKTFALDISSDTGYSRPSIDVLFESAAMAFREKLVAILLTGANSDGSEGLLAIADKKGLIIVQDPDEAESSVMPKAALAKVKADHILTKKEIFNFLLTLHR